MNDARNNRSYGIGNGTVLVYSLICSTIHRYENTFHNHFGIAENFGSSEEVADADGLAEELGIIGLLNLHRDPTFAQNDTTPNASFLYSASALRALTSAFGFTEHLSASANLFRA
uniref:Uncharacterized protein n=1 Tax=Steinernema glaseri TaxID=37863 RepID=A0A1I7Z1Y9_9BILA